MTMQQPKALRLAEKLRDMCSQFKTPSHEKGVVNGAIQELRRLHAENQDLRTRHYCNTADIESLRARVQELGEMARENRSKRVIELEGRIAEMEAQMAAIGAGGVEPLRKHVAAPQVVQAAVPQIDWESAAEKIAIKVADNCGTVPNLTHPHIYLGLKKLFATAHPAEGVPEQAGTYAEARECEHCNHVGINDAANGIASCTACKWNGDSPKEDKCPDCEAEGTMTASCPKCHHCRHQPNSAGASAVHRASGRCAFSAVPLRLQRGSNPPGY